MFGDNYHRLWDAFIDRYGHMTCREVSNETGLSASTVSRIKRRQAISLTTYFRLMLLVGPFRDSIYNDP